MFKRMRAKESVHGGGWGLWLNKQASDFEPGHCSSCPIPNLNPAVSY